MEAKKPVLRMCAVCRAMKDKGQLIRVSKNKLGEIFVDMTGKAAGRGAFVCKDIACVEKCKKQRSLSKAFKCEVKSTVYDELIASVQQTQ